MYACFVCLFLRSDLPCQWMGERMLLVPEVPGMIPGDRVWRNTYKMEPVAALLSIYGHNLLLLLSLKKDTHHDEFHQEWGVEGPITISRKTCFTINLKFCISWTIIKGTMQYNKTFERKQSDKKTTKTYNKARLKL